MSANEPVDPTPRTALVRETWLAALGILVILGAVKHIAAAFPGASSFVFTAAAAVQLYYPLTRIGQNGVDRDTLGLSLNGWALELRAFAVAAIVTGVPYAGAFTLWQATQHGRSFELSIPDDFVERIFVELAVVGLAEELFFRGYLQERLERLFPARRSMLGAPFGLAIVLTSAVFAAAHFVGEYRLARLGPFFPSLLFGVLRARRGRLLAPILYHAFCNLLAAVLAASHR